MTSSGMLQWTGRIATVAIVLAATSVMAQDAEPKKVAFEANADIVSAYFFRGYNQEDAGLIIQPDAAVTIAMGEPIGQMGATDLSIGIFNSLHSKQTGYADDGTQANGEGIWYEADFYAALSTTFAENYSASVQYTVYAYPNSGLCDVEELSFTVAYDDSEQLGDYSVNPYITWAMEIDETNSGDANGSEKQYFELGAGKDFVLVASETAPVTLSVPLTVGMSFDGYFRDSQGQSTGLGFINLGVMLSMPLADMATAGYGNWNVYGGGDILYLNADSAESANGGDEWALIGRLGVSMAF